MKQLTRRIAVAGALFALSTGSVLETLAQTGGGVRPGATTRSTTGRTGSATGAGRSGGGTREYFNSTMVGDAMISVDPETRQLIIITDDETNTQIKQVIDSLDRPKPQVLIKVVFVQVTHNNDLDFGVEGSYTHTSSSGNTTGTAGTDFGLAAAQAALGGGFYQIAGQDFDVMVRTLQVAGKTEILSRPSILARNNQQATIIVGQEVPFITNSRITDQGQTVNTVQYQDIGIILRVTPFITADGLVEMIVTPEISALSNKTVPISDTVNSPIIDKRSADTVVVTPSGKTVVIGGLIEKQKNDQERKVPILGDIPLLGYAFKRVVKVDTKTELLIFLTPFVMQTPGELVRLSDQEGARMEMAPKAFGEQELQKFLEGLPVAPPKEAPKSKK
jgi:general secretion pathway protein D